MDFQALFSELDKEARKVGALKGLLADLLLRQNMGEEDKLRLAKAFLLECQESLHEMNFAITKYKRGEDL